MFDCWFESGSMPYAQVHYPFEKKKEFDDTFPADFIAEGIDQTRGWCVTRQGNMALREDIFNIWIFFGKFINSDSKTFCKTLIPLVINASETKALLVQFTAM